MVAEVINATDKINLMLSQWLDDSNLHTQDLVRGILALVKEQVVDQLVNLENQFSLDTAEGVYLDYWGERLGLKRPVILGEDGDRFGFGALAQSTKITGGVVDSSPATIVALTGTQTLTFGSTAVALTTTTALTTGGGTEVAAALQVDLRAATTTTDIPNNAAWVVSFADGAFHLDTGLVSAAPVTIALPSGTNAGTLGWTTAAGGVLVAGREAGAAGTPFNSAPFSTLNPRTGFIPVQDFMYRRILKARAYAMFGAGGINPIGIAADYMAHWTDRGTLRIGTSDYRISPYTSGTAAWAGGSENALLTSASENGLAAVSFRIIGGTTAGAAAAATIVALTGTQTLTFGTTNVALTTTTALTTGDGAAVAAALQADLRAATTTDDLPNNAAWTVSYVSASTSFVLDTGLVNGDPHRIPFPSGTNAATLCWTSAAGGTLRRGSHKIAFALQYSTDEAGDGFEDVIDGMDAEILGLPIGVPRTISVN